MRRGPGRLGVFLHHPCDKEIENGWQRLLGPCGASPQTHPPPPGSAFRRAAEHWSVWPGCTPCGKYPDQSGAWWHRPTPSSARSLDDASNGARRCRPIANALKVFKDIPRCAFAYDNELISPFQPTPRKLTLRTHRVSHDVRSPHAWTVRFMHRDKTRIFWHTGHHRIRRCTQGADVAMKNAVLLSI